MAPGPGSSGPGVLSAGCLRARLPGGGLGPNPEGAVECAPGSRTHDLHERRPGAREDGAALGLAEFRVFADNPDDRAVPEHDELLVLGDGLALRKEALALLPGSHLGDAAFNG